MPAIDYRHMTAAEKLELTDSIEQDTLPISPEWQAELDRRNARFAAERGQAVSWSTVKAKLRP
jgi:putative addiction module component (TIGR02574 family)